MTYRLATLGDDAWELESGVARHAEYPDSFQIPPASERENLALGSVVQLIFKIRTEGDAGEIEENIERMWVFVSGRVDEWYVGRLQNQPQCTNDLRPGTQVIFSAEHIIDIAGPPPAGWEPA